MESKKICLICNEEILDDSECVICPDCGKAYHKSCWRVTGEMCVESDCREKAIMRREENEKKRKEEILSAREKVKEESNDEKKATSKCLNCGTELSDGQAFCPHCGAAVQNKIFCRNCGTELANAVGFCPKCGLKSDVNPQESLNSAISEYNSNLNNKKGKNKKKVIIISSVTAFILIVAIVICSLCLPFGGTYDCKLAWSESSTSTYEFKDGKYIYTTDTDTYSGTYTVDGDNVTLTNSEGNDTTYIKYGKYLYSTESVFTDTVDIESLKANGYRFVNDSEENVYVELNFDSNGNFSFYSSLSYTYTDYEYEYYGYYVGYIKVPKVKTKTVTVLDETGTYTVDGNVINLKNDNGKEGVALVIDGKLYYRVLVKQ